MTALIYRLPADPTAELRPLQYPVYIGIDPGVQGGLAVLCGDAVRFSTMPDTEQGVYDWLSVYSPQNLGYERVVSAGGNGQCKATEVVRPKVHACVEWITAAMFGIDKAGMSKLYGSYRSLRMALVACGIPFLNEEESRPVVWQRSLGIAKRKQSEKTNQWKNRLKQRAQILFPKLRVTLTTSDALLIAHYCRSKFEPDPDC